MAVPAWAGVIALTLGHKPLAVTYSARVQRSNLLYYSGVWRRWLGRWLFAVAGLGRRRTGISNDLEYDLVSRAGPFKGELADRTSLRPSSANKSANSC